MKYYSFTILIFLASHPILFGQKKEQNLPINRLTGLVSIVDSMKVGADYSAFWAKEGIDSWTDYIAYGGHVATVYGYEPQRKIQDHQLLGPDGVHFLSEKEKPWSKIRMEYFARVRLLSQSLKSFLDVRYHHLKNKFH